MLFYLNHRGKEFKRFIDNGVGRKRLRTQSFHSTYMMRSSLLSLNALALKLFIMILLLISLSLWLKNITLYGMSVNPHTR